MYNWVDESDLLPISTAPEDRLAVDKKMTRLNGQKFWLYGDIDPQTNEILQVSVYLTADNQTTRWSLTEIHRCYQLDGVEFSSIMQTISDQFSLKMAINFKSFNMGVGMLSNVSFEKYNDKDHRLQTVSEILR